MARVAVVGAGAAGTMAAIFAAAAGAETLLLERTKDGGRKILISGGGRCNILPARLDESRFITDSPSYRVRHILRTWPLEEQVAFFERDLDLPLLEDPESGKLFPRSQRARDVRDKLLALARRKGVSFVPDTLVTGFRPTPSGWAIEREAGDAIEVSAVVIATGGLSVPSTGSDGLGLQIAAQLGHTVHGMYPALTPLTGGAFAHLSGVSLPVIITARSNNLTAHASGGFLFTHRGYSGPAVLDISHVAVRSHVEADRARITIQWTPLGDSEWNAALRPHGSRSVLSVIADEVPSRLAEALLATARIDANQTLAHLSRADRLRLIDMLVRCPLPWTGDEGYRKAEVTGGGVALTEIDPQTMESRRHKRLFLCGEMLDVFGPIGGYNFLWAWVTGRAAGIGAASGVSSLP